MATRWVYFFGDGQAEGDPRRKDVLGGKGAALAAMCQAGLPVPPGFTIATECCRLFLDGRGRWPDGLEQQVGDGLERLERATGRTFGHARSPLLVSVRSGAAVSMPGMMDTILNCGVAPRMAETQNDPDAFWRVYGQFVLAFAKSSAGIPAADFEALRAQVADTGGELVRAYMGLYARRAGRQFPGDPWGALVECIETVFRSWLSERAIAYRRQHAVRCPEGTAVTVQAMFGSQVSGVAFTANPNDPAAEEIIIESAYGLGEAIVSGEVRPDTFVLDRGGLTLKRSVIGPKTRAVFALGDAARRDPDAPSLTEAEIRRLAELAMKVEGLFGFPVDIEWGLADGRFALLQARPIRALAQTDARQRLVQATRSRLREGLDAGRGPWVPHNLGETLPHPTPLTWSVIRRFMSGSGGFGATYKAAGFDPSPAVCREGFLDRIAGRVYMDAALAPEMFFRGYPFRYDVELLRRSPDAAQSPPTLPAGSAAARFRAARRVAGVNRRLHRLARDLDRTLRRQTIPAFVEWCRDQKPLDLPAMPVEELIDLWHRRRRSVLDEFAPQSLLPTLIGGMALADLRSFLAECCWDEEPEELANALSAPAEPDRTMLANAGLFAVAQGRCPLERWLAEYGHRGPEEFDLASPRWRERPEEVSALAERLAGGTDPMDLERARVGRIAGLLGQLRARLGGGDRERLDGRVALVRRYIAFREDGKHYLMLGYDLLRDVALEAGRRLGVGGDVFFLTDREMSEALRSGSTPHDLIARRKDEHRAEARVSLPHVIDAGTVDAVGAPPAPTDAGACEAFAVSTGSGSGPVRIVRSPRRADALGRGYVLVCSSPDPAWTPLFVNAAALILERGGTLSHGAVVAREMGIPAVVLDGATGLFREGETVTVDGHHGLVSRSAEPPPAAGADEAGPARHPGPTHVPAAMVPPPPGRRERAGARLRNVFLLVWGAYLLAAFALPANWLYRPSLALLDGLLWPLVVGPGRPAAAALLAAALAAATMLGQRLLADNRRLREAKRRANRLLRAAAGLGEDSPRRAVLTRLAAPVPARVLGAALLPLSVLLGPMVMTFVWCRARLDPASWNAPPGAAVSVVATVDSDFRRPITLTAGAHLALDESSPASRTLPDIRETLEKLLAEWQGGGGAPAPAESQPARARRERIADLRAYLDAGVPPQGITWKLRAPQDAAGRFPIAVAAGDAAPIALHVVLGDVRPPEPAEARGDSTSPIRSVKIVYPPPEQRRVFWAPLAWAGKPEWDAGWLVTYLAAYLPVMFLLRWTLRIA